MVLSGCHIAMLGAADAVVFVLVKVLMVIGVFRTVGMLILDVSIRAPDGTPRRDGSSREDVRSNTPNETIQDAGRGPREAIPGAPQPIPDDERRTSLGRARATIPRRARRDRGRRRRRSRPDSVSSTEIRTIRDGDRGRLATNPDGRPPILDGTDIPSPDVVSCQYAESCQTPCESFSPSSAAASVPIPAAAIKRIVAKRNFAPFSFASLRPVVVNDHSIPAGCRGPSA